MRYLLALLFSCAVGTGSGYAQNCTERIQSDPIGTWFDVDSGDMIGFNLDGVVEDYVRGVTGATWMKITKGKLRVAHQTYGAASAVDGAFLCGYRLDVPSKPAQKNDRRSKDQLHDQLTLCDCDLKGIYRRMAAANGKSPLIGRWFDKEGTSVIEFAPNGDYIVHDRIKMDVGVEVEKITKNGETEVKPVEKEIVRPDRTTYVDKNYELLGVVKEVGVVGAPDTKDESKKVRVVEGVYVYDSVSLVLLPGQWLISGYNDSGKWVIDGTGKEGTVGISTGGFGTRPTGTCRYKIDGQQLALSRCTHPIERRPPAALVKVTP